MCKCLEQLLFYFLNTILNIWNDVKDQWNKKGSKDKSNKSKFGKRIQGTEISIQMSKLLVHAF